MARWSTTPEAREFYALKAELQAHDEAAEREASARARVDAYERRVGREATRCTFATWTVDVGPVGEAQEAVAAECREWVAKRVNGLAVSHSTLVLSSPQTGVGKTHLSLSVLREMVAAGYTWERWHVSRMLDSLRPGGEGEPLMRRLMGCGVLVIDDLGVQRGTPWELEQLETLIDRRTADAMPLVITTNAVGYLRMCRGVGLGADDRQKLGAEGLETVETQIRRIASRLHGSSLALRFGTPEQSWPDRRTTGGQS